MKHIFRGLILLLAAASFAQQSGVPPYPPGGTPPTFPPEITPKQQMPPDTKAPPTRQLSNARIEQLIEERLRNEPELADTNVRVETSDKSIRLSGAVDTDQQRELALRIVQSYAGDRKIVDKIKVRRQT